MKPETPTPSYPECTCGAPDDVEPEDHDDDCPENPGNDVAAPDDCVWDGTVWPEHDYDHSNQCRRCGAECED